MPKIAVKNVLVVSTGKAVSATQNISFGQPFRFGSQGDGLALKCIANVRGKTEIDKVLAYERPDLVILSRYVASDGMHWARRCKKRSIPIIFHIDDDLLSVPKSLGEEKFNAYNDPKRLEILRNNIESCDLLYVSTPALKERFEQYDLSVPIRAGLIYCSVEPADVGALTPAATGPVIGYMGTGGHSADLDMIMPAVCSVMEKIPNLQFEIFGTIEVPKSLTRFGTRIRHIAPVADYADFLPFLRSLGWWIGLAPLEDNIFNRCKADTKWVEYSLSGMAVIASDLPVYHHACQGGTGILAKDLNDWEQGLGTLLMRPDLRDQMIADAQNKLRTSYSHDALQAQVLDIFQQVGLR